MIHPKACLLVFCAVLTLTASAQDTLRKPKGNRAFLQVAYSHYELLHDCFGIGIGFEKMLDKAEQVAVTLPVTVGIPGTENSISFMDIEDAHKFKSSFSVAPGIKFFLGRKKAKARYAIGASVFFEAGRQRAYVDGEEPVTGTNPITTYSVFGYMLTNSLYVYPAPRYSIGISLGTGMAALHHKGYGYNFNWYNEYGPGVLAQLSITAGYRF